MLRPEFSHRLYRPTNSCGWMQEERKRARALLKKNKRHGKKRVPPDDQFSTVLWGRGTSLSNAPQVLADDRLRNCRSDRSETLP